MADGEVEPGRNIDTEDAVSLGHRRQKKMNDSHTRDFLDEVTNI